MARCCVVACLALVAARRLCAQPTPRMVFDITVPAADAWHCPHSGSVLRMTRGSAHMVHDGLRCSGASRATIFPDEGFAVTQSLTLAAWVVCASAPRGYQTVLFSGRRGADGQAVHFSLCLFDGRLEFKFMDEQGRWHGILRNRDVMQVPGGKAVSLSDLPRLEKQLWHHVAATFDRGRVTLFLDGQQVLSGAGEPSALVPSDEPILVGEGLSPQGQRAYLLDGVIDGIRVYDAALTPEQIRDMVALDRPDKSKETLSIPAYRPAGYDPEFKVTLPRTRAYRRVGETLSAAPVRTCRVVRHGGASILELDDRRAYPMAMMPEPYVSDDAVVHSCEDFAAAGVDLYSTIFWSWQGHAAACSRWWLGPGRYDFERIDARIRAFLAAHPNARIFPRIKLNPPSWWLDEHPDHITRSADGTPGQQVSLASIAWTDDYSTMLRDVVRHMESADYAGHIIGYQPAGGGSSEWFWYGATGDIDYCQAAVERWRTWLRHRYDGDPARLRTAWQRRDVTFEQAAPPSPQEQRGGAHGFFHDPATSRRALDYAEFLADITSGNIVHACKVVKEATGGRKLAGVFYGYSVYCFDTAGFHGLRRVLRAPSVDFLCAPTAYDTRRAGDPGVFISAYTGSYHLHNKLYWDEVDTRTHLYPAFVHYRTETLDETLSVLRRATGRSLTQGTGLWWFLLAGNATFHDTAIMEDIARMRTWATEAMTADRRSVAEVAVFVDEPSMLTVTRNNRPLHKALLRGTLDELSRMGAPFDLYLLSDLAEPGMPDCRLAIFLNAFRVPDELRRHVREYASSPGRVCAWVYAPGYVTSAGLSLASMHDLTGLRFTRRPGPLPYDLTIVEAGHALASAALTEGSQPLALDPVFVPDASGMAVVGRVGDVPALVANEADGRRTVYSLGPLRREVLQGICRFAGVHVYSDSFDTLTANRSYLMLHTATAGQKRIRLPQPCGAIELVTGTHTGDAVQQIDTDLAAGVTRIWRLQPR